MAENWTVINEKQLYNCKYFVIFFYIKFLCESQVEKYTERCCRIEKL